MEEPPRKIQRRSVFVQSGRCRDHDWLPGGTKVPSLCVICAGWFKYDEAEPCRFEGFRKLRHPSNGVLEEDGFSEGDTNTPSVLYPGLFENNPQDTDINDLQIVIAKFLQPILEEEVEVHKNPNLVFRHLEKDLVACDVCNTSILFSSWFCTECALEICCKCFKEGEWDVDQRDGAVYCIHEFRACSRMGTAELKSALSSAEAVAAQSRKEPAPYETSFAQKCRVEAETYRVTPRLVRKHAEAFQLLWPLGIPISVDPPQGINFDPYSSTNLDILHGTEETFVSKCDFSPQNRIRRWKSKAMTVRRYLQTFTATDLNEYLVVKIEELPHRKTLAEAYPLQYMHYLKMIPFALYASPSGFYNLASHYALDQCDRSANKPDLGPKLYLSASNTQQCSVTLRMNMTGTMYVLANRDQSHQNVAVWTTFRREDVPQLRAFLSKRYPNAKGDAVHGRKHYLDHDDLRRLREQRVIPFSTVQKPGVAILIPAGCVYQAKAIGNIVQVANGFVDYYSIASTLELIDEWRKYRLPDTVQIKWILWYAWNSLVKMKDIKEKVSAVFDVADEGFIRPKSRKSQTVTARDSRALKRHRTRIAKGKTTPDEYAKTHIYRCPHATCSDSSRPYASYSVFDHLKAHHGVKLDDVERNILLKKPLDEWSSTFDIMMSRRPLQVHLPGLLQKDPIVISP
ncbi:hypothetical protein BDY19DRAFT_953403 [Irpex rosettiformis]|uniref:Uncharacterized protein n=1 Tax=Irpex rosettiformis TaxID=378272 RepID=A0ACB8U0R8_9APHY|nr:hypothetical protein BDY19DRAFT_953403 [Irpex rosettiformis]